MKDLHKRLREAFKNMNRVSKNALKIGLIPIALIYIGAAFLYISAGRLIEYHAAEQLMHILLELGKEFLGAVCVTALIVELIDLATGKETETAENKK